MRGYSGMGPYRKNTGAIGGVELYQCANVETTVSPAYTNKTVSANMRGPAFPQGFFGMQSMMDDVAYKLKMDPVEFRLKNMTRKFRDETPYTKYTLEECIVAGRREVRMEEALARTRIESRTGQARRRRWRSAAFSRRRAAAAPSSRSTPAALTPCLSASPTSAPAQRRRWG